MSWQKKRNTSIPPVPDFPFNSKYGPEETGRSRLQVFVPRSSARRYWGRPMKNTWIKRRVHSRCKPRSRKPRAMPIATNVLISCSRKRPGSKKSASLPSASNTNTRSWCFAMASKKRRRSSMKSCELMHSEVVSVICTVGSTSKDLIGIEDQDKLCHGTDEPMCNPIFQAKLMNKEKTHFNVLLGLCVGHDSLFFKHADAYTTVLAVKDRVTGHNPLAPIYLYDHYYKKLKRPLKAISGETQNNHEKGGQSD